MIFQSNNTIEHKRKSLPLKKTSTGTQMFKVNNENARTASLRRCSAFTVSFEHNAGREDNTISELNDKACPN